LVTGNWRDLIQARKSKIVPKGHIELMRIEKPISGSIVKRTNFYGDIDAKGQSLQPERPNIDQGQPKDCEVHPNAGRKALPR